MKEFTEKELKKHSGQGDDAPYVAHEGNVYDVSSSGMWKGGKHMNKHQAGADLTAEIENAPHGPEVFERVEKVGTLEAGSAAGGESASGGSGGGEQQDRPAAQQPDVAGQILALHPHPILVHFPQAVFVLAPVFLALFYLMDVPAFERTAYYLMVTGLLTAPAAYLTGLFHWVFKYAKVTGGPYRFKIIAGQLLIVMALAATLLHTKAGTLSPDEYNIPVLALYFIGIPLAAAIGHAGGIIVFGRK